MSSVNVNSQLVQMQQQTSQVQYMNSRKNMGNSRLDREGFMRLMLAQIQNQDPTNPTDNAQMMQQQLALEQVDMMKDVVHDNRFSRASSMIGQMVEAPDAQWDFENGVSSAPAWDFENDRPKTVSGPVEAVQFDNSRGKALLKINGAYYDMEQVRQVQMTQLQPTE